MAHPARGSATSDEGLQHAVHTTQVVRPRCDTRRPRHKGACMSPHGAYLLALGFLLAGCAGATVASESPAASSVPASPSEATSAEPSTADAAIVGVWRGEHE